MEFTNNDEYEQFLKSPDNKDKLIVIDFYADWCGPCRKIKPAFRKLAAKFTDVVFAKIDVDEAEVSEQLLNRKTQTVNKKKVYFNDS